MARTCLLHWSDRVEQSMLKCTSRLDLARSPAKKDYVHQESFEWSICLFFRVILKVDGETLVYSLDTF